MQEICSRFAMGDHIAEEFANYYDIDYDYVYYNYHVNDPPGQVRDRSTHFTGWCFT